MNVVSLRNDPVHRILDAISDLSGDEGLGSPEVRRVAELVLSAARQGYVDLGSLPFVVLAGLDGSDVTNALSSAFRRWSSAGHPPAYAVVADFMRQLGFKEGDPLFRTAVGLGMDSDNEACVIEDASTAIALAGILEMHGDVCLSNRDRAMVLLATIAVTNGDPVVSTASVRHWMTRTGESEAEIERLEAIVKGVMQENAESVIEICRASEDGREVDVTALPDSSWVRTLMADPIAAVIAGIVRDGFLISERQRGDDQDSMPVFASTAGALFGRLFAPDPEPTAAPCL